MSNQEVRGCNMTKQHFAGIALVLSAALFVIFIFYLPIEVAGHRPGMSPTLVINSGFLAITAAICIVFIIILFTKGDYVRSQLATFTRFRHLLILMVKRDFVTRYRRSILGVLWSLLNPLLTMLVLTMVFSTIFQTQIQNFPVYLLGGQLIFNFFSEATNTAMGSIIGGAGTIKKVYVPKYIFPVSRVLSSLVNLGFTFIAFMLVFFFTRAPFHWTFVLIPIPLFYAFVFSMGVGMLLSAMVVFFRDVTHLYGVTLTLLMFLTPIFYSVEILPTRVYHLLHLNPLFHFVTYFRALTLDGVVPGLWANIICIGFALAALCMGMYVKMSQQDKYILFL